MRLVLSYLDLRSMGDGTVLVADTVDPTTRLKSDASELWHTFFVPGQSHESLKDLTELLSLSSRMESIGYFFITDRHLFPSRVQHN